MKQSTAIATVIIACLFGVAAGVGVAFSRQGVETAIIVDGSDDDAGNSLAAGGEPSETEDSEDTMSSDVASGADDVSDDLSDVLEPTPTSNTITTTTAAEPQVITANDALARYADTVVGIEAMGCRAGAFASGVLTAPGVVSAPFDFRYRTGLVVVGRGPGLLADAEVLASPNLVTRIATTAVSNSPVFPQPGTEPAVEETAYIVYRDRFTLDAAVIQIRVAGVTGNRLDLQATAPIPADAIGGLLVSLSGEPVGLVVSVVASDAAATTGTALDTDAATTVSSEALCEEAAPATPPERYHEFAVPRVASSLLNQRLANALADADWPTVRVVEPGKAGLTDQTFVKGWGALQASTLVPVWVIEPLPGIHTWRMGLVAHEFDQGAPVTKVFCVTWVANVANGTVQQLSRPLAKRLDELDASGFTDPHSLVTEIQTSCRSIEGD